jgi:hypothetical protein
MPILPQNRALYPGGSPDSREWRELRQRVRERAADACEWCRVPNGVDVCRRPDGAWLDVHPDEPSNPVRGAWRSPDDGAVVELTDDVSPDELAPGERMVRIVCTVAHLDHDPTANDGWAPGQPAAPVAASNLRFLCQRCHNRHDAGHRRQTAKRRRAAGDLFGDPP